ncbi:fasciclin-like arabinogalactan protein 21 [Impatiens glandulifera]|uniref:fasciclin-like arabinogalactan protein 21 n=1 Tax=Impatiens glandulifera TaxID=253017 RepID=UPI001FB0BC95|nr:fasciclin-like arabinogalactan protein 21 [Impatiens glandulifera]
MATEPSCSHWWHCPIYFVISLTLAVISISSSFRPNTNKAIAPNRFILNNTLSLNASLSLRRKGFSNIATLLNVYPELLLISPETTIFAVDDAIISSFSLYPTVLKQLLRYHASPSNLPMKDLLKMKKNSCLPTLLESKNVAVTKIDTGKGSIEINNVSISHPDLFLGDSISIHGILGAFYLPENEDRSFRRSPTCESNVSDSKPKINWERIVRLLGSNGFVSFAIGLHSVLPGIVRDYSGLSSVTVLVPTSFSFVAASPSLLDRIVRFHILPVRLTEKEMGLLPEKSSLFTLLRSHNMTVTENVETATVLALNEVEIIRGDVYLCDEFVIHEISRPFQLDEFLS